MKPFSWLAPSKIEIFSIQFFSIKKKGIVVHKFKFRFEKGFRVTSTSMNKDKPTIEAKLWIDKEIEKHTNKQKDGQTAKER